MSAGTDYKVKIDFDTKRLVGGMESVEWGTIEVYSSSGGTDDINEDNNRDIILHHFWDDSTDMSKMATDRLHDPAF